MSYPQKKTILNIIIGILILMGYFYFINKEGILESTDVKEWANLIFKYIGFSAIAIVILQIIFHVKEAVVIAIKEKNKNEKAIDTKVKKYFQINEKDKLIELKAIRVGYTFAIIGFICGILALILDYTVVCMLNTIFVFFIIGFIIEGFVALIYYKMK